MKIISLLFLSLLLISCSEESVTVNNTKKKAFTDNTSTDNTVTDNSGTDNSGTDNGNDGTIHPAPISNDKECAFNFYEGEQSDYSLVGDLSLTPALFGKLIPLNQLKAIASASSESIVEYSEANLNIDIFAASDNESFFGCRVAGTPYFSALKKAPANLIKVWDDLISQIGGGTVLGLYLPKGDELLEGLSEKSVTFILPQSDKWTIVHELTHHLFNLGSIAQGDEADAVLFERFDRVSGELGEVANVINSQIDSGMVQADTLNKFIVLYGQKSEMEDVLLKKFPLEEATIEKLLLDRYYDKTLNLVEAYNERQAYAYLTNSAYNAISISRDSDQALSSLVKLNELFGAEFKDENTSILTKTISLVSKTNSEVEDLLKWANETMAKHNTKVDLTTNVRRKFSNPSFVKGDCKHGMPKNVREAIKNNNALVENIMTTYTEKEKTK